MSLEGKFLIAHPNCPQDSLFYKSVIYIYQDKVDQGTVGVIINKPSRYSVREIYTGKNMNYLGEDKILFHGGPTNTNALVLLHTADWTSVNTMSTHCDLRITSDTQMLDKIARADQPKYWKLFGGLSTWAPGQLQAELTGQYPYKPENSWLYVDATKDVIFNTKIQDIWNLTFQMSGSQMFDQYF